MPASNLIDQPILVELYRYWRSKFAGDRMPSRRAIDPVEIPALLPWIFLMDVGHLPLAFRYRLIGTGIVNFLGRDFTGRAVDVANYGARAARMIEIFRSAVDRRSVTAVRGRLFYVPTKEFLRFCWTMMPLSTDGEQIDVLLCGYVPENEHDTASSAREMDTSETELILDPRFDGA
ncbi:MAG: PAS domain-containing protein [Proteobacteria bacterium]|nr:PAS domain-containing protein [Pseudomonadota bacterium]